MEGKKKARRSISLTAIIGLISTVLTICGSLSGALIGGITTIYKIERGAHHVAIQAPKSDQKLTIDTEKITISSTEAVQLDPTKYLIYPDLGFSVTNPPSGWQNDGKNIYADLFKDEGINLSPLIFFSTRVQHTWDDQAVLQVRHNRPVTVKYVEGSSENGVPIDPTKLETDTLKFYSQVTILVLSRSVVEQDYSLAGMALGWGSFHQRGVNNLIAKPNSPYVFEQVSWKLTGVDISGQRTDPTLQRWALFAESPERYYVVEIQYVPITGQSKQVWEDLQALIDSFQVIQ